MKIYWLDVETSGLSPEHDALLELAITEASLERPFDLGEVFRLPFVHFRNTKNINRGVSTEVIWTNR